MPFSAKVQIIGNNPYVRVPPDALKSLLSESGLTVGPIPVRGTFHGHMFRQMLVKYQGVWRLFLNTPMQTQSGAQVGEEVQVELQYDERPRSVPVPQKLTQALAQNKKAKSAYAKLAPAHQKEISHYLNGIKTEDKLDSLIKIVLQHLLGENPKALGSLMRRPVKK